MKTLFNVLKEFFLLNWKSILVMVVILLLIAGSISLMSCSKGDTIINNERVPVEFSTSIVPYQPGSRAQDMWVCYLGYNGTRGLYSYDIIRNIWRCNDPVYPYTLDSKMTMIALYPAVANSSGPIVHKRDNGERYITCETQDIFLPTVQDILYSDPVTVDRSADLSSPLKMNLKHALSRLNIYINKEAKQVVKLDYLRVRGITLGGKMKLVPDNDKTYVEWSDTQDVGTYETGTGNIYR